MLADTSCRNRSQEGQDSRLRKILPPCGTVHGDAHPRDAIAERIPPCRVGGSTYRSPRPHIHPDGMKDFRPS